MGQFSAPNYELHDEQNDWSPNDEIDPDLQEPDDWDEQEARLNALRGWN